jgi:cellulose synthase/poly-beta-1,6-N-acetylglucosamine synthase-like glycosyltransferase
LKGFIANLRDSVLGTPGKRVYAAILGLAIVYSAVLLFFGLWLVRDSLLQGSPFFAALIAITMLTALPGALHIAQFLVFSALLLIHGPERFVAPPTPIPEDQLPTTIIQVPGRNEPFDEVVRSIGSVLALKYPADRISVQHLDNSDDDRWKKIAENYRDDPRVDVIHRDGTQGFKAGNLNLGIERLDLRVLGDPQDILIGLLDAGDMFAPESVRLMATEFVHNNRLGFVQSLTRVGNPDDTVITKVESYITDASRRFYFALQNTFGIPSLDGHHVLIRLQALLEVNKWDATKLAEDWATGIKMLLKGWRGKWVDYAPTDLSIVSAEASPCTLEGQQKQKSRWATGGSELVKEHLFDCLGASLPWNERADFCMRLLFYPMGLPRYLAMLMAPFWISLAALTQEGHVGFFGILSAAMLSALLLFLLAESATYLREGAIRKALLLILLFPVQTAYNLPILPHIAQGVLKGFRYAVNTFIITPKKMDRTALGKVITQQRAALFMALWLILSATLIFSLSPYGYIRFVAPLLVFAVLTVIGVFLVPVTERLRHFAHHAARGWRGSARKSNGQQVSVCCTPFRGHRIEGHPDAADSRRHRESE